MPQSSPAVSNTGVSPRDKQTSSKHSFDSFLDEVHYVHWMESGDLKNYYGCVIKG